MVLKAKHLQINNLLFGRFKLVPLERFELPTPSL
ncbi:MAG: hypothetical protein JWO64_2212 [Hyphomicrobiales bacterium]|nr:hypothetical protein [Hyphomicrobiales bacterium]